MINQSQQIKPETFFLTKQHRPAWVAGEKHIKSRPEETFFVTEYYSRNGTVHRVAKTEKQEVIAGIDRLEKEHKKNNFLNLINKEAE